MDLKINGHGTSPGGDYNEVVINGEGTVRGDVKCKRLKVHGAFFLEGRLDAKDVKVYGKTNINGSVNSETIQAFGSLDVAGKCTVETLKIAGETRVNGSLAAKSVNLRGRIKVSNDLETETLDGVGAFFVSGLLNAEKIKMEMHGQCKARELGGSEIKLTRAHKLISKVIQTIFSPSHDNWNCTIDTIEGDDIDIEYVKARIVRGRKVRIGQECIIERVEYSEKYEKDESSTVKTAIQPN